MKNCPVCFAASLALCVLFATRSEASITSYSLSGYASVQQYRYVSSTGGTFVYDRSQSDPYLSFMDPPYIVTTGDSSTMSTMTALTNLMTSTATSWEIFSDIRQTYAADSTGADYAEAHGTAQQGFTFTVDSPSVVHLVRTDLVDAYDGQAANQNYFLFDGNFYAAGSASNLDISINVGPGTYSGYYSDYATADAAVGLSPSSHAQLHGLYDLQVTSIPTPEPASLSVLALGALALAKRRRR